MLTAEKTKKKKKKKKKKMMMMMRKKRKMNMNKMMIKKKKMKKYTVAMAAPLSQMISIYTEPPFALIVDKSTAYSRSI